MKEIPVVVVVTNVLEVINCLVVELQGVEVNEVARDR